MSAQTVLLDVDENKGIASVTLNRAHALNALDQELSDNLRAAVAQVEFDESIRAVVVQGAGEHFMAGGDIRTFHAALAEAPAARRRLFERFISEVHEAVMHIRRMPKPVIASVQGAVAGFGLSLMNSCDLVIAADNAYFTLAYCHIGTSPDGSGTFGLPRTVGIKRAMEIALLGERFDAAHAHQIGLVNRVVAPAELERATYELAT
ncbi:MAG TPA: enoyl-CoA hydratase/isomerase family protein, partial [Salinisphaeraceae bacterium]|nr:enoyl-CoA hydratase/isomerase family protein [Salinisphaeraceae bacterium]